MSGLRKKILVISHDAGGANILASLIKKHSKDFNWHYCVYGPAQNIFESKKINKLAKKIEISKKDSISKILINLEPELLLTGTSWGSSIEMDFIKTAKELKIRTASFLDHWVNYRERFGNLDHWQDNLPEFILVGDKWAYKIALDNNFPKKIIKLVENPYFEEVRTEVEQTKLKHRLDSTIKLLYVSEPIAEHAAKEYGDPQYWGYTEYKVLENLLEAMKLLRSKRLYSLKIRLHPAESSDKYNELLRNILNKKNKIKIVIVDSRKNSLIKDCLSNDIIIGSDSMALVIALLSGKKVISYIPSKIKFCSLPQQEIQKTSSLSQLLKAISAFKLTNKLAKPENNSSSTSRVFITFSNKLFNKH